MAVIASLIVQLEANIAKFVSGMDKANTHLEGFKKSLNLIKWDSIVNLGEKAIRAGGQVYEFSRSIADQTNNIQRQAQVMGVSTDLYQKLSYAARLADVDTSDFATSMKFLARSIEEAKAGTGNADQYFRLLGIDVQKLSAEELKLENITYRIADAFNQLESGTAKTDIAMALMGRSGQNMITFMDKGGESIRALGEEAEKFGRIVDRSVIQKGSEADENFKKLDATISALKMKLAGGSGGLADALMSVFEVDLKSSWRRFEEDFSNFLKGEFIPKVTSKAVFAMEEGMAELKTKKIIDPKMFADPEGIRRAKELMSSFVATYKPHIDALKELGIVSQQFYTNQIKWSEQSFQAVKKAFQEGQVSVVDYGNALKKMTETYEQVTGKDVTAQLVELDRKFDESAARLDRNAETYRREYSRLIDEWSKERNRIMEESPAYVRANLTKWEEDLRNAKEKYDAFVSSLKPVEIRTEGGMGSADRMDMNVKFWGEGSTRKPLSEKISEIMGEFGGMQELLSGLGAMIDFSDMTMGLDKLEKKLASFKYGADYLTRFMWMPETSINMKAGWQDPQAGWFQERISETQSEISLYKMQMLFKLLQGFSGSYQFGTPYVPKTGLAVVHEGERIISRNVSYGDSTVTFNISGGNPKTIADEIAHVLKYRRSGSLRELT